MYYIFNGITNVLKCQMVKKETINILTEKNPHKTLLQVLSPENVNFILFLNKKVSLNAY